MARAFPKGMTLRKTVNRRPASRVGFYERESADEAMRRAYVENVGREPRNFPEGTLGWEQWNWPYGKTRKNDRTSVEAVTGLRKGG